MQAAGFDIGTTTVCGVVIDTVSGEVLRVRTCENDAVIRGKSFERLQDPERIFALVQRMYREFVQDFRELSCIGLTGQMHGILYTDEDGAAVSPLYTWQDERGGETAAENMTYALLFEQQTGSPASAGYGLVTHYYNVRNGLVPAQAVSFCTIQDYVGMRFTARKRPLMTASDAASLGGFDIEKGCFRAEALDRVGIRQEMLPECAGDFALLGKTPEGIPVGAAIGDNQASVIGSVRELADSVLVNVGTGSQVSMCVPRESRQPRMTGAAQTSMCTSQESRRTDAAQASRCALPESRQTDAAQASMCASREPICAAGAGERTADMGEQCSAGEKTAACGTLSQDLELRPLTGAYDLLAGSGLCGGRAYAALEQFLRRTVEAMTGQPCAPLYERMDQLLAQRSQQGSETDAGSAGLRGTESDVGFVGLQGLESDAGSAGLRGTESDVGSAGLQGSESDTGSAGLQERKPNAGFSSPRGLEVDTRFCGTRREPGRTGAVTGLTLQNFLPEELIYGVLRGMTEELAQFYDQMQEAGAGKAVRMVGSGNGLRRNRHLIRLFEERFGMNMQIPVHQEEASYGAALYAMTAAGIFSTLQEAQKLITYCGEV